MQNGTHGRDRKEVQQLIDLGKSKGFLTYEEVNDALPADVVAADQVEDVMSALGDEDIEIVDAATQVKIAPKRIAEEEALETKKVPVRGEEQEESDPYYSKSNDPVRMYLRKMGSVSLLTREGEVEIAKRIEQGEHAVLQAILNSPIAVREIVDIGDKLRKHKIRVKDIIRDAEDDDQEFDEEEADRRIIRLIDKVKRLDKKHQDLLEEARPRRQAQDDHAERSERPKGSSSDARRDAPQQRRSTDRGQAEVAHRKVGAPRRCRPGLEKHRLHQGSAELQLRDGEGQPPGGHLASSACRAPCSSSTPREGRPEGPEGRRRLRIDVVDSHTYGHPRGRALASARPSWWGKPPPRRLDRQSTPTAACSFST
jgi:hypothetical protein